MKIMYVIQLAAAQRKAGMFIKIDILDFCLRRQLSRSHFQSQICEKAATFDFSDKNSTVLQNDVAFCSNVA